MVKANNIPGIPNPELPVWAGSGGPSLAQGYINKKVRRPSKADGGWLGDIGPNGGNMPSRLLGMKLPGNNFYDNNNLDSVSIDGGVANPNNGLRRAGFGDTASLPTPVSRTLSASDLPGNTSTTTPSGGINWDNVGSAANKLMPFMSNIANSFRRVPQLIAPGQLSPITLNRVSNAGELANIDSQTRAQDVAADIGLDGNTAAAVRSGNLVTKLKAYGDSYSRNAEQNASIGNQENMFNAGIAEKNLNMKQEYNNQRVSAQVAQQRASSQNLANASDKFVALQNAKAQRDLDSQKWTDASRLFNKGVVDRYQQYLSNPGDEAKKLQDAKDEEDDSYRTKKRMGGSLKRLKKVY